MNSDLRLLLWEFHIVEDTEDDSEEVVPPVLLKGVAVTFHDLKHDREASAEQTHTGTSALLDYVHKTKRT